MHEKVTEKTRFIHGVLTPSFSPPAAHDSLGFPKTQQIARRKNLFIRKNFLFFPSSPQGKKKEKNRELP